MDVHGPYQPKKGLTYIKKLRSEWLWHKAHTSPHKISPTEHIELRKYYRDEIIYVDQQIGLLLDLLYQLDTYNDTIVILCADHGDEFREHGHYSHGRWLYDELIRVPLIIRHPFGQRGTSVNVPVGLVDILPTVVDMVGLDVNRREFVGQSLWPTVRDGKAVELRGFVVNDAMPDRDDTVIGIRNSNWKLIVDSRTGPELYNLENDPLEQLNVVADHPDIVQRLRATLWAELASQPIEVARETNGPKWDALQEQEILARLQALGYVEWVENHKRHRTKNKV
jgi:arylsulfatase